MAEFTDVPLTSTSFLSHSGRTPQLSSNESLPQTGSNVNSIAGSHPSSHSIQLSDSDRYLSLHSLRNVLNLLRSASLAFSNWTVEWTPFILVVTYYIVSVAIFVMCTAEAIKVLYFFYSRSDILCWV